MSGIGRLAGQAPVPVYAAVGKDMLGAVERLGLSPAVRLVRSPRHAAILLVAGETGKRVGEALQRLHDQVPHPRATVWWNADPDTAWKTPWRVTGTEAVADRLVELWRDLLAGTVASEADCLPDAPAHPWRGVGPYGQGGEGMMGGTPYGRPMAMVDDDIRDGLALDAYKAQFGPFLTMLPPGLCLKLTLQGDVIQTAEVAHAPYPQDAFAKVPLMALARLLRLLDLAALGERLIRVAAEEADGTPIDPTGLRRAFNWSGALRAIPPNLGRTASGSTVRDRVRGWWTAAGGAAPTPVDTGSTRLGDLLHGLEWHEAMLVLNSFDLEAISAICARKPRDKAEGRAA